MAGGATYNFSAEKEAFQRMLDKYGELIKNHRDIIDMFNEGISKFGRNAEQINETIERSPLLEKYYNDLQKLISQMAKSRENMLKAVQSVTKNYEATSSEDIQKLFELERQFSKVKQRVKELQDKQKQGNLVSENEKATLDDLVKLRDKINQELSDSFQKSESLWKIHNKLNEANSDELKAYEKYNKEIDKSERLQKRVNKNLKDTSKETERLAGLTKEVEKAVRKVNKGWELASKAVAAIGREIKTAVKTNWDMENAAYKTAKAMGMNATQAKAYHRFMLENASDLVNTLGLPLEEITQFQNNFSKATGRAINMTNKQMKMYGSMSKLLGEDVANGIIEEMDKLGNSMYESAEQAAKLISNVGAQGLNLSKTSAAFVKNMKLAHSYNFKRGVDGIQKMTLLSERLKFNLESIASAADNLNSIEGSISTAANVQKLGGSFAMNFSDPMRLMYESWNDFEGLTERIVKTVQGKATFNRQTGEMEMGSLDRRFLQEFAKAINVQFEDVYQMATQQAKYQDMESSFQRGLTEEQRTAIGNRAQWNSTSGKYEVTYYDKDNKQHTRALSEIDSSIANTIMKGNDTEDAILGTTNNIYDTTKAIEQLIGRANKMRTDSEKARAIVEGKNVTEANAYENWFSDLVGKGLDFVSGSMAENPGLTTTGILAGGAALGAGSMWGKEQLGKIKDKILDRTRHRIENTPNGGRTPNPSNSGGIWSKIKSGVSNIGNKIPKGLKTTGKVVGVAALAYGLISLFTGAKKDEQAAEQVRLKQQKAADKDSSAYYDENMSEVESQTDILRKIEENTRNLNNGISATITNPNGNVINSPVGIGSSSSVISSSATNLGIAALLDSKNLLNFTKSTQEFSKAATTIGKSGTLMGKFIPVLGTAITVGLATSNATSTSADAKANRDKINQMYRNGEISQAEYIKLMKQNSKDANTAIGAAIGSMVGTAVGAIGGSVAPGVGTLAGAGFGSMLGDLAGGVIGSLTSDSAIDVMDKLRTSNRVGAFDYETSKFGINALSSGNIALTAMQAQIKSSDILGSIYELLSANFETSEFNDAYEANIKKIAGEKNWKIYDPFGWGENNDSWFSNGGIVRANNGIASVPGNSYYGDKIMARVNSGEMILNKSQQSALFKWIDALSPSNIIKGISDYAKPTFIDKTKALMNGILPSSNNSFNNSSANINLNINGTIKLDGGNGRSVDLRNLIESPQFRKELVDIIINQMSKNSNGGKVNYNTTSAKQGSFFANSI